MSCGAKDPLKRGAGYPQPSSFLRPRRPRPGMGAALPTVSSPRAHRPPNAAAPHRRKLALKCSFLSSRKSDYISPLDDLAFDMYQDPEVAQIIRKLDERKREAVQKERYDYAKKLKQAVADLQKVLLLGTVLVRAGVASVLACVWKEQGRTTS